LRLQPQVGICGYRVDLGVLDDDVPGRFVCGIECDGVAYHSMETVRDRDRLRQQVLEARGWMIHRVWSTDWFKDRQGQIERLLRLIDESRIRARDEAAHAKEERVLSVPPPPPPPAVDVQERAAEPTPSKSGYTRPLAPPYETYRHGGRPPTGDILEAPVNTLAEMIVRIVEVEGPVHEADVMARIAGVWSTKAGSRIQAAIRQAAADAVSGKKIEGRGAFLWRADGACRVRSRLNTGISGDRIAPEEIAAAVELVFAEGHAFQRQALITETRAVMGYSRTGPILEETIGRVLDDLLARGTLGEASEGLVLRAGRAGRSSETTQVPAE
jgi:very-short-patch-repair endonuclease